MDVHTAKLGATAQLGEDLSRIEQSLVVEGAFDALLMVEVGFREHRTHQVAFLHADTVLTGQHATDRDTELENVAAEIFGLSNSPGTFAS